MERRRYVPGKPVIYRKQKHSVAPGPRAKAIEPAPHGEDYSYIVEKFWVVVSCTPRDEVVLTTRRGKQHVLAASDPNLRPANWWERWLYRKRFPKVTALQTGS